MGKSLKRNDKILKDIPMSIYYLNWFAMPVAATRYLRATLRKS